MTSDDFSKAYWAHYISLEKEFAETCRFVTLDEDNYKTFSSTYLKLILGIGSEVDISIKYYCKFLDASFNGDNMGKYYKCITDNNKTFFDQQVSVLNTSIILKPWFNVDMNGVLKSPEWWGVYNKCKHERCNTGTIGSETKEYLRFANLKYTLDSLASLYQILIFIYKNIADNEGKKIKTPLPGSRLFVLTGADWNNIGFYRDMAFYLKDGCLIQETGTIMY